MTAPEPSVDADAFDLLVRRAGLSLDAGQRRALHEVYGHFEAMLERNRRVAGEAPRVRGAEPAHMFVAGQGWDVA